MTEFIKSVARVIVPKPVKVWIYRQLAIRYVNSLSSDYQSSQKTILVINHFWDQDLKALREAPSKYNMVIIDAPRLFKGAKIHFSQSVINLADAYDSAGSAARLRWRKECELILDHLISRCGGDVILAPSDSFYWIRELIEVARERKIKTFVYNKEGVLTPSYMKSEVERLRSKSPYISDHMFVWSERQARFWEEVGVSQEKMTVIGQSRSDLFYTEKGGAVDSLFAEVRPLVTFYSYMDNAYIPIHAIRGEGLTWSEMKAPTHEEVFRLAEQYEDYNFVVKTHPQQPDLKDLQLKYNRTNLKVVGGATLSNELLQRSELIIAFQSTVVIEAMFLKKNLIYTYWDGLLERFEEDLLPFHTAKGIVVSRSLASFGESCRKFLGGDRSEFEFSADDDKSRDEFVQTYLYRPDGHVCERFFAALDKLLA